MSKDGELRSIFRDRLPHFQWSSVESAGTVIGIPDSEFCSPIGTQGWIEFKRTATWAVKIDTFQVAWAMQRSRYGGNCWIAVRRLPTNKKENGKDELWLMHGNQAADLFQYGLKGVQSHTFSGGPSKWLWSDIEQIMCKMYSVADLLERPNVCSHSLPIK